MTWRMSVVHRTAYEYESAVVASFNELRMTPVSNAHQMLVHHRTHVSPSAPLMVYRDYWGSMVEAFDIHTSHESLEVVSDNVVETSALPQELPSFQWSDLQSQKSLSRLAEFLVHTALSPDIAKADVHKEIISAQATPRDAVNTCVSIVRDQMTYVPGATHVFTPAHESWASGRGVCQDYSHVTLSLLRSVGIPARYVSGYQYTGDGVIGETVVGESHAWLEAWVGEWMPVDPTSGSDVGEKHIVVAYGRDYNDVSPMRGIFSGGQSREINVSVSLTRQDR